ncbi:MAG: hypothetical protein AAFV37_04105 [Pseudomonadota bacterium]
MHTIILLVLFCWFVICLPLLARGWTSLLVMAFVAIGATIATYIGAAVFSAGDLPQLIVVPGEMWRVLAPFSIIPFLCRVGSLALQELGQKRGHTLWLDVVAVASVPAIVFLPELYRDWTHRELSEACSSRPIQFSMSGETGAIRRSGSRFSLYFEKSLESAVYTGNSKSERPLCRRTKNGTERVEITAFTVRFTHSRDISCQSPESLQSWEKRFCETDIRDRRRLFPDKMTIFDPRNTRVGAFGIARKTSSSLLEEAIPNLSDPEEVFDTDIGRVFRYGTEFVVAPELTMPDGTPFAVKCRAINREGELFCRFRHSLAPNLDLAWSATLAVETIAPTISRINALVFEVCASALDHTELCGGEEPID